MSDTYTDFGPLNVSQQAAQEISQRGFGVVNAGPTDDRLIVGFYRKSVVNTFKSKELGKRIAEDHDFVKIQHPGENLNIVDRPVQDSDKHRWPQKWAQFQQGKQQVPDGIPITLLYPDKPSITDMLIGYNIHTVEQLANLSGNAIATVGMGCQEWVNKANKYLDQATKGVDFHRFEAAIQEKDKQLATQARQIQELSEKLNAFMSQRQNPANVDIQTAMIDNRTVETDLPRAVTFQQTIQSPDLSAEVRIRKPRSDRGKPRGPRSGPE